MNPSHEFDKDTLVKRTEIVAASFSGPLPPPDMLSKYNEVIPGAAERILKMAEQQSEHRRKMESRVITGGLIKSYIGVVCGLLVALSGLAAGTYISIKGNPWAGVFINLGSLGGLVYTFVVGVNSAKSEMEEKRRNQ